jgi:hypothetical protein
MERCKTWSFVLCFAALSWPSIIIAQTTISSQTEIERRCSEQADRLGLHGAERKNFRTQCKQSTPVGTPVQVPGPPPETSEGNGGVSNLHFENGVLTATPPSH